MSPPGPIPVLVAGTPAGKPPPATVKMIGALLVWDKVPIANSRDGIAPRKRRHALILIGFLLPCPLCLIIAVSLYVSSGRHVGGMHGNAARPCQEIGLNQGTRSLVHRQGQV